MSESCYDYKKEYETKEKIINTQFNRKEQKILQYLRQGKKYKELIEMGFSRYDINKTVDKAKRFQIDPREKMIKENQEDLAVYMSEFRKGNYSKEQLINLLNKIEECINKLGNLPSHMAFLARVYTFIEKYGQSNKIFNELAKKQDLLTSIELRIITIAQKECIETRYKNGITQLLDESIDEQIIIESTLERVPKNYEKYINMKFIKETISDYNKKNRKETTKETR